MSRGNSYIVLVDGQELGSLRVGKMAEFPVPPGQHNLQVTIGEVEDPTTPDKNGHVFASHPVNFTVEDGQTVEFMCGPGPTFFQPFRRVHGDQHPDVMLKPKIEGASWRTY